MQKLFLITSIGLLFFCMAASAQKVNTDSLSLVSAISRDQLSLGKLQNKIEQQTNNKQNASEKAQNSANKNMTAADNLNNDPNNKKLARKVKTKAGDAKRDSRNARRESENLDDLNKDIQNLKNRIGDNQVKLDKHINDGRNSRIATDTIPF